MTEMTEANVSLQALSALELCSGAFEDLESDDVGTRVGAVVALAGLVECSYGDEAEAVGAYVRESGGLEQLIECLGAEPLWKELKKRTGRLCGSLCSAAAVGCAPSWAGMA